ncbi:MAG TPA: NAD-dependent epimerase [Candidatus Omnitrophica bacterium]|nr:MAG: NAD-dependent epimerase [Omnitrophica WOR_2 bacterium GWA2_45_18]HBR15111.1 NAD-dependent epimerase [Candidatus Omnitrophota bacterium]
MNFTHNTTILLTGGAGFVGSHVIDQLLPEGIREIVVIDNFVRGSRENIQGPLAGGRVRLMEGDIRDRDLIDEAFKGVDFCFHLAALRITQCAAEPREALEIMYDGTFNVLEACVKHHVKKLVFASSASVYGQAVVFPTREEHHPYGNYTLYGAAKMANELMCRSFSHMYGLKFNALRYFNIYGPRMDAYGKYTEVLIRWYHAIREGKPPLIYGDGRQTMDFVYIEEIARATILALKADVCDEAFNIAGGVETSLEELCYLLLEVMASDLKPRYVPLPEDRKKVEVWRRLADTSKAKAMIGFEAKVDLKEGLRHLVRWLDKEVGRKETRDCVVKY